MNLLLRIFYERAYAKNPTLLFTNELFDLKRVALAIRVGELEVPEEYLPEFDMTHTVHDAFRNDPFSRQCARFVENAALHTNPLDMLHEMAQMMGCIERRASLYHQKSMLPFEVTFGLSLGGLLVSDVPNFQEIAAFIADCTPAGGLCSAFEFSAATTAAAREYCASVSARLVAACVDGNLHKSASETLANDRDCARKT
jgi:hypothetical protein